MYCLKYQNNSNSIYKILIFLLGLVSIVLKYNDHLLKEYSHCPRDAIAISHAFRQYNNQLINILINYI